MLVLLSSSLTPVESKQITSCLADFACDCEAVAADDEEACFVESSGQREKVRHRVWRKHTLKHVCIWVHTSVVFRQQRYGEVQTSPPLELVLLGGFGHCLQLMLPQ